MQSKGSESPAQRRLNETPSSDKDFYPRYVSGLAGQTERLEPDLVGKASVSQRGPYESQTLPRKKKPFLKSKLEEQIYNTLTKESSISSLEFRHLGREAVAHFDVIAEEEKRDQEAAALSTRGVVSESIDQTALKKYQQKKLERVRAKGVALKKKVQVHELGDKPLQEIIEQHLSKKYKEVKRKVVYDRLTKTKHSSDIHTLPAPVAEQRETAGQAGQLKQARKSLESQTSIVEPNAGGVGESLVMSGAGKSENSKSMDRSGVMRSEEKKKATEKHATFDPQIEKKEQSGSVREKSMSMSRQKQSEFLQKKMQRIEESEVEEERKKQMLREKQHRVERAVERANQQKQERLEEKKRKERELRELQERNLSKEQEEREEQKRKIMSKLHLEEQKMLSVKNRAQQQYQSSKDRRDKRLLRSKINKVLIEETPKLCQRYNKHEHRIHEIQQKLITVSSPRSGVDLYSPPKELGFPSQSEVYPRTPAEVTQERKEEMLMRPKFVIKAVASYNVLPRPTLESEYEKVCTLSPDEALVKHFNENELQLVSEDPNYFIKDKEKRAQISLFQFLAEDEPFFESENAERRNRENLVNIKQKFHERKRQGVVKSASLRKIPRAKPAANLHEESHPDLITPVRVVQEQLKDRIEEMKKKNRRKAQEHEEGMELKKRDREIESKDLETRFYEKQRQAQENRRNEFQKRDLEKHARKKARFEKELKISEKQEQEEMEEHLLQKFLPEIFRNMRNQQVSESVSKEIKRKQERAQEQGGASSGALEKVGGEDEEEGRGRGLADQGDHEEGSVRGNVIAAERATPQGVDNASAEDEGESAQNSGERNGLPQTNSMTQ